MKLIKQGNTHQIRFEKARKDYPGDVVREGNTLVISDEILKRIKQVFRNKDVDAEKLAAEQWLTFHPPKKDYTTFFLNWLMGAKERRYHSDVKVIDTSNRTATKTPSQISKDSISRALLT